MTSETNNVTDSNKHSFYCLDDAYYSRVLCLQGAYPVTPSIKKFHMQKYDPIYIIPE